MRRFVQRPPFAMGSCTWPASKSAAVSTWLLAGVAQMSCEAVWPPVESSSRIEICQAGLFEVRKETVNRPDDVSDSFHMGVGIFMIVEVCAKVAPFASRRQKGSGGLVVMFPGSQVIPFAIWLRMFAERQVIPQVELG